nr:dna mismatch repair protein msh3 [Quercus suber]
MSAQRSPPRFTQGKKQQSISSFFTKPHPTPKSKLLEPEVPSSTLDIDRFQHAETPDGGLFVDEEDVEGTDLHQGSGKRGLESTLKDNAQDPPSKRMKRSSVAATKDILCGVEPVPARVLVAEDLGPQGKIRSTGRASKYLFSSSPLPQHTQDPNAEEGDDEVSRQLKQRLHEKFVKRLGKPDSIADIKRRNRLITEETQEGEEAAEEDEIDEEQEVSPAPKGRAKKSVPIKKGKDKLTPMERQVLAIKQKHMDTLLVVEVGYKFRFFGEDARTAAKELSIVCIPGKFRFDEHPSEAHLDRFASASIPVHRLHVHVKRLVSAGHKVGVVRQLETAALKAAGDNRNKAFERGLTNLYTKGTYIDDQEGLDATFGAAESGATATGHLLCLTESRARGWGSDEKVQIGLVAVQPSTGDIIYDDFEDGWMRSELETRLLHIAPCEFLIVGEVSKATEKLVQHLSGSKTNVFGDKARVERIEKPKTMAAQAYSHITKFYADKSMSTAPSSQVQSSQETGTLLDKVHRLSENATVCLSAMITYLADYGLEHVFDLTKYFQSFSARAHMLLNGNTLNSLEVYRNQTDHRERGSLFWTLDRTKTRFGQRLLRKWVGRPLLDRARLYERVAAVEELKDCHQSAGLDRINELLTKTKTDLERSLIRIYYKKASRPELLAVLQTLQLIAQAYAHVSSAQDTGFQSALLSDAITSLPRIGDDVVGYLEKINAEAAKTDDKYSFFRDEHETEDITDQKAGIAAVEHDLDEFRTIAAEKLKRKKVDYVTVAGIDYLIELDNQFLKNVPASWAKISGTKKVSRYHAPEVVRLVRERDQHKEALANACDAAFKDLLTDIGSKYQAFRDCIQSLAVLDCLLSLSEVASQPGYCKPEFTEANGIDIEGGRHPMVEQLLLDNFVPNDLHLSADQTRALLITGPNMGGKSSYVRSVALITIMAQIGSYVPARTARLGLLDAVFTRMGAFDNMMKGESTFMVELSETSDILKQASPRSLVILDELGRGTSTHDGLAIAQAVLHHLVSTLCSFTLFITHYQTLARMADHFPAAELRNVHMRFSEHRSPTGPGDADDDGDEEITFLYEVADGVAHRSYGLNVAKLAGLPRSLIDEAGRRSRDMELQQHRRRLADLRQATSQLLRPEGSIADLEHLVAGLAQL